MKLTKKKIVVIFILVVTCIIGFFVVRGVILSQREAAIIMEQREAYARVNYAFRNATSLHTIDIEEYGEYRLLDQHHLQKNDFGIIADVYLLLLMYEIETGNILEYDTVIEYFSQEFEPDGSLRLYNNGNHPEIQAYVEWMWEEVPSFFGGTRPAGRWLRQFRDLLSRVAVINGTYSFINEENGFIERDSRDLSPQMLRVLAHAANDPNIYIPDLNLTELQQQGY